MHCNKCSHAESHMIDSLTARKKPPTTRSLGRLYHDSMRSPVSAPMILRLAGSGAELNEHQVAGGSREWTTSVPSYIVSRLVFRGAALSAASLAKSSRGVAVLDRGHSTSALFVPRCTSSPPPARRGIYHPPLPSRLLLEPTEPASIA